MPIESLSPLLDRTLSQTKPPVPMASYYRSRLFITPSANNPLVAAASPVFSILDRICTSPSLPPIEQLRSSLEHELHAFDSRLRQADANNENHQLARFLLNVTIDELLGKNYLRTEKIIISFQAFSQTQNSEKTPQDIFFECITLLKRSPDTSLLLLEFAYYCLITGFEGPYHGQANGRQELDCILEELYLLIIQHRQEQRFDQEHIPDLPPSRPANIINKKNLGWISLLIFAAVVGWTHYHLLDKKIKTMPMTASFNAGQYQP